MWALHHYQVYADLFKYTQNKTCNIFTKYVCWDTYTQQFIYYYKYFTITKIKFSIWWIITCSYKDTAQCITYIPIKQRDIINIKCALSFFDEFTSYNIPDE